MKIDSSSEQIAQAYKLGASQGKPGNEANKPSWGEMAGESPDKTVHTDITHIYVYKSLVCSGTYRCTFISSRV